MIRSSWPVRSRCDQRQREGDRSAGGVRLDDRAADGDRAGRRDGDEAGLNSDPELLRAVELTVDVDVPARIPLQSFAVGLVSPETTVEL